ncbi:hypothetical protein [Phytoactinopolyspora limicola]|uniref:hypothetical protein n=1 Tax=Phytoactinopolyspora limicola TaxID=2715536 RepID=UPI00140C25F3|nr:hypothetical protein [Phytoactinopolyspora limicola]
MAVVATDPALGFLSTVSGVTPETVPAAINFVNAPFWSGVMPALLASVEIGDAAEKLLSAAGFTRTGDRALAVKQLDARPPTEARPRLDVVEADDGETFPQVLLAGYQVGGVVAAFIRAEHRLPVMRRVVAMEGKRQSLPQR